MHCLILMNGESMWNTDKKHKFPTIEDIFRARELLDQMTIRKTPLQRSDTFSKLTGTNIFLKLESLQKTGSFKVRGAFVKINMLSENRENMALLLHLLATTHKELHMQHQEIIFHVQL